MDFNRFGLISRRSSKLWIPFISKTSYKDAILHGSKYLFFLHKSPIRRITYDTYRTHFKLILEKYQMDKTYRLHNCRKQFVSMAKKSKIDEYAIKYIVGHTIDDLTESVYTERDIDWLKEEIEKIK